MIHEKTRLHSCGRIWRATAVQPCICCALISLSVTYKRRVARLARHGRLNDEHLLVHRMLLCQEAFDVQAAAMHGLCPLPLLDRAVLDNGFLLSRVTCAAKLPHHDFIKSACTRKLLHAISNASHVSGSPPNAHGHQGSLQYSQHCLLCPARVRSF